MYPNKNSFQDKKDLDKFIKFLALKSTQIIVQSRLGEKILTQCNPYSGNDWFNIAIQDHPDVLAETKKVLSASAVAATGVGVGGAGGESIITRLPLCVEISLQTIEGDKMVLEVWTLGIIPEQSDPTQRATYAVYNRMGILLKSLISVTRATPAYKLSRRQATDSYHIYYRIYVGNPEIHNLGDGNKQFRVGQLCTTVGTLNMSVAYRTKMTISPTQTGRDNTIMLKSDHFLKDLSPKHIRYHHIKKNEKKIVDLDKPMRAGAFVDANRIKQYTEEDYILPETPPFSWLLKKAKEETYPENQTTEDDKIVSPTIVTPNDDVLLTNQNSSNNNNHNNNNSNCQKSFEASESSAAVTQLLPPSPQSSTNTLSPQQQQQPSQRVASLRKSTQQWSTKTIPEDERLLKELHFPFATANTPISDLAKFYRDCFNAPPLVGFIDSPEEEADINDLSKQLEQFETSLGDFDSLVTSLCCQSVDSNSNS